MWRNYLILNLTINMDFRTVFLIKIRRIFNISHAMNFVQFGTSIENGRSRASFIINSVKLSHNFSTMCYHLASIYISLNVKAAHVLFQIILNIILHIVSSRTTS